MLTSEEIADAIRFAEEIRKAPSGEGEYASTWKDKPHRLIYDAAKLIVKLATHPSAGAEAKSCDP